MAVCMKDVANQTIFKHGKLSSEERNLLSIAYQNTVTPAMTAWKVFSEIEKKETVKENPIRKNIVKTYKEKVGNEVRNICIEILELIDGLLSQDILADDPESKALYYKIKADSYQYLTEISTVPSEKRSFASQCLDAYNAASNIASQEMQPSHPLRLSIALNFAKFYSDVLKDRKQGAGIAEKAFLAALNELDTLHEDAYKDVQHIMLQLKDLSDRF